jgi:kynurenine formamidase
MAGNRRIIDLAITIEPAPGPEHQKLEIEYERHEDTAEYMMMRFECGKEDLPEGLGWANEYVTLGTHVGTHMDAPWHYHPVSEGKKAKTIDEVPVEWFYGDGVVIDMSHKKPGELITTEDLKTALQNIGYTLKPFDIVFVMTGADKLWGTKEYWSRFPGLGKESTLWLCEQGIKVMGTDSAGWDRPFWAMVEEFKKTGDSSVIWGAHFAGIEREYCQIEKLTNLDQLPSYGFKVACPPVKIKDASSGWVRPIAIVDD